MKCHDLRKQVRYLKTKKESGTMFSVSGFVNKLLTYLLRDKEGMEKSLEAIEKVLEKRSTRRILRNFSKKKLILYLMTTRVPIY